MSALVLSVIAFNPPFFTYRRTVVVVTAGSTIRSNMAVAVEVVVELLCTCQ